MKVDSEAPAVVAPVVMYTTGMCPYCVQAERLLRDDAPVPA